jgi:hypothetical protein
MLAPEVGIEVDTEKTKYMVVSHHQNVGHNHKLLTGTKSFETVARFKYLETTEKHIKISFTKKFRAD